MVDVKLNQIDMLRKFAKLNLTRRTGDNHRKAAEDAHEAYKAASSVALNDLAPTCAQAGKYDLAQGA